MKVKLKNSNVIPYPIDNFSQNSLPLVLNKNDKVIIFFASRNDPVKGGELFIPKTPSINIVDLVKALDKKIKYHIVGIRPGEKLHEVLCPEDSARDTIEFKDYYLIRPLSDFTKEINNNYKINKKNEKGKFVKSDFVYSSNTNSHFLNIDELKKLI